MDQHDDEIIKEIERFADRHGLSDTAVSRLLTRNPGTLRRLRNGGGIFTTTAKRLRAKMKEYDVLHGGEND